MKFSTLNKYLHYFRQYHLGRPPYAAYVSGWHGHHNLGDEAVYLALKHYFGNHRLVDFPRRMPASCLRALPHMTLGLLAGGTMINGVLAGAIHTRDCFARCPRTLVLGAGVALPEFWISRHGAREWHEAAAVWKETLRACDFVGVRGPDSATVVADWGVDRVEVIGDPALYFAGDEPSRPPAGPAPCVGLNLVQTDNRHMYGQAETYWQEMTRLAGRFKAAGWTVRWFVLRPNDLAPTRQLAAHTGTSSHIAPIYRDCRAFIEQVQQCDLFIGTRLHAVALSTAAYVPSISLEYHPKCSDYMKSIGQAGQTVRLDRFQAESVWELAQETHRRRDGIVQTLFSSIQSLRRKQLQRAQHYQP